MQINHSIPNSKYFVIAQPPVYSLGQLLGKELILNSINSEEKVKTRIESVWEFKENDSEDFVPDSMCKLAYGLSAAKLMALLKNKYPIIRTKKEVHFYLLEKLD